MKKRTCNKLIFAIFLTVLLLLPMASAFSISEWFGNLFGKKDLRYSPSQDSDGDGYPDVIEEESDLVPDDYSGYEGDGEYYYPEEEESEVINDDVGNSEEGSQGTKTTQGTQGTNVVGSGTTTPGTTTPGTTTPGTTTPGTGSTNGGQQIHICNDVQYTTGCSPSKRKNPVTQADEDFCNCDGTNYVPPTTTTPGTTTPTTTTPTTTTPTTTTPGTTTPGTTGNGNLNPNCPNGPWQYCTESGFMVCINEECPEDLPSPGPSIPEDLCKDFKQPGCNYNGCSKGYRCETDVEIVGCVPTACECDPKTGDVVCSTSCGGGSCVVDANSPGSTPIDEICEAGKVRVCVTNNLKETVCECKTREEAGKPGSTLINTEGNEASEARLEFLEAVKSFLARIFSKGA